MARFIHYKCPDCEGTFRHLQHPIDAPPPDRCALCGAWMNMDEPPQEVFVPQAPGIKKSAYSKSVDQSYRAMEDASILRAEDAADQLQTAYRRQEREDPHEGDRRILDDLEKSQVAELKAGIKITDMQDPSSMREGDNAVVGTTARVPGAGFQTMAGGIPNAAPGVGPAMAPFVSQATADHSARATAMIRAGQIGKH